MTNEAEKDRGERMSETKKDVLIGILYALSKQFSGYANKAQREMLDFAAEILDEIYYPKKDLSQPTSSGEQ